MVKIYETDLPKYFTIMLFPTRKGSYIYLKERPNFNEIEMFKELEEKIELEKEKVNSLFEVVQLENNHKTEKSNLKKNLIEEAKKTIIDIYKEATLSVVSGKK